MAEPLIPIALKLTTDDELLGLAEYAPRHTGEVLLRLRDGVPYQQVMDEVTAPVAVVPEESPKGTDGENWQAAADRSQAVVITDDESLRSIIEEGDFGRWKVFLHPTQERLVGRTYSGPARVSGGPGTGKTIVALHRVKHLVEKLPPATTSRCSSPPSTRTSPPTCAPAFSRSAGRNCSPASTSCMSTSWRRAWSARPTRERQAQDR
ncbi:hypothetical protein NKH18_38515 [Streptomyces sp. M10(2022)]